MRCSSHAASQRQARYAPLIRRVAITRTHTLTTSDQTCQDPVALSAGHLAWPCTALVIKPHFPKQTASFPRHAPLFPDTLTLLLGPRHALISVNFSQRIVDCTGKDVISHRLSADSAARRAHVSVIFKIRGSCKLTFRYNCLWSHVQVHV